MNLIEKLEKYRAEEHTLAWEGTFKDYFDIVISNPKVARLSHARVYDMIMEKACIPTTRGFAITASLRKSSSASSTASSSWPSIFSRPPRGWRSASEYSSSWAPSVEASQPSSPCSSVAWRTTRERRMERYTPSRVARCTKNRFTSFQKRFAGISSASMASTWKATSALPASVMLHDVYGGKAEDVAVERIAFSEKNRIGIGTFSPSDPKSQDISELTGSIDLATVGQYGSESDPRAYRFDGELNVANRRRDGIHRDAQVR
jgi:serine protein kinase